MEIKTERLILREMNMNDYEALYAVLADSDIMKHYPYSFDEKRVRSWIDRNVERYRIFGFGLWAVCLKSSGEMIGDCGLTMQNIGGVIKPEIGYHIRHDMQRKGFAKEAATAVRDWTFKNTPFNEIYSYMKYTNEPSSKSAMSWGCKKVDEFKDEVNEITYVYAITKEEWQKLYYGGLEIIKISDRPDLIDVASKWFNEKWYIPKEAYVDSMTDSLSSDVPAWYVIMDGDKIISGVGVIQNDFHERKDLAPNVCGVYTDEEYRGLGLMRRLLDFLCEDLASKGIDTLYLITDHTSLYERYGWEFYCMAMGDGEEKPSRIYIHKISGENEE